MRVLMTCIVASLSFVAVSARGQDAAPDTVRKEWVWLTKQGVFGYGYRRADGYWVIDAGTKRRPGDPDAPNLSIPATTPPATALATTAAADYGFVAWLNGERARYGLGAVFSDPALTADAQQNNAWQQVRGMGHFFMGRARRQNAAIGTAASVGAQWMASSPHRAALLDPTISTIGIAGLGVYWTFNAR